MRKPLAIELFAGLHGWGEGLASEGWRVVAFDLVDMCAFCEVPRPTGIDFVIQDVLTLSGRQFKDADLIVSSSPCQEFSYRAMPFKRAKAMPPPENGVALFNAQFKIQREAIEATRKLCPSCCGIKAAFSAGYVPTCVRCHGSGTVTRHIPMIVENVRAAQSWTLPAKQKYGSMYLWGDVPPLMIGGGHVKQPESPRWFHGNLAGSAGRFSSHSKERKRWTAAISKIPFPLAQYIARVFKPEDRAHGVAENFQPGAICDY